MGRRAESAPIAGPDVLTGGRQIKLLHESPVGFSLAPEHNSNHTMRTIMYSLRLLGAERGRQSGLKSQATLEAIKYVKALYDEAMIKDVLTWDASVQQPLHAERRGLPDPGYHVHCRARAKT